MSRSSVLSIDHVSPEGPLPLSSAQKRLWFLAQIGLGAPYNVPVALRLHGPLDRGALRRALDCLVARHETLRSVFPSVDGEPVVRLLPPDSGFALVEQDLQGAPGRLDEVGREEAQAPFDLATGPLIRGRLLRLAPDEHVLLLTQHHIVTDGWSIGVLFRELGALYGAFVAGEGDPLPPLAVQYHDHTSWLRRRLAGGIAERQAAYWRRTLAGAPALLTLPTDRPRPTEPRVAAGHVQVRIEPELASAVARVSRERGATLFMTLLGAWATVLGRLSGQDDVVIGVPTASRARPEVEGLVGFFVNTLALRIDLSGRPSFADLLGRVRKASLGAQVHQDLPFEQVVDIAAPPRRLDVSPLFQVMLAWQGTGATVPDMAGLRVERSDPPPDAVKFDLELNLGEVDGWIVGGLAYSSALFDPPTMERHVGYLISALRALVSDVDRPASRADLIDPAERTLLVETWNRTAAPYPGDRCIHELFEEQARRTPSAVAVSRGEQALTYGELDRLANRLARRLRRARGRARRAGGAVRGAAARDGRGAARDPEGGRSVRAAGPELPGRATARAAVRLRAGAGDRR